MSPFENSTLLLQRPSLRSTVISACLPPGLKRALHGAFQARGKQALMTVLRNEGRWDKSNVEFSNGDIRVYDKNSASPALRHIDYGLGVFKRAVFDALPAISKIDLAQIYQECLARGQLAACEVPERFYESILTSAGSASKTARLKTPSP